MSVPGKYMMDQIDDEEFHDWILAQMSNYIQAKIEWGTDFRVGDHVPNFRHFTGNKHIEYKIRKRENDKQRHGYSMV